MARYKHYEAQEEGRSSNSSRNQGGDGLTGYRDLKEGRQATMDRSSPSCSFSGCENTCESVAVLQSAHEATEEYLSR